MGWLSDKILSLLLSSSTNILKKTYKYLKFKSLKKKIDNGLKNKILAKYQNEIFYNTLDLFLSRNKIFDQFFYNQNSTGIHEYISFTGYIDYYSNLFIEEYPKYKVSMSSVKTVIRLYYEVVFDALNSYKNDDTAKIVINNLKELFGELSSTLGNIGENINETKAMVNNMNERFDDFISNIKSNEKSFDINNIDKYAMAQYFKAIQNFYLNNKQDMHYFERKIFKEGEQKKTDALSALLIHKRILLLGEAGCGKTFEAQKLVFDLSTNIRTKKLIPIYLPLIEYGKLFSTLMEGICKALEVCFGENTQTIVSDLLKNSRFAIVFDGIDDIQDSEQRDKCILEIRNMFIYYGENYYFISSRANRYNNEFDKIKKFYLGELTEEEIRQVLAEEKIYKDLPKSYYRLFKNPLLLKIGIKVLKRNISMNILNRSMLFDELMLDYCGQWDSVKGNTPKVNFSHSELFMILGKVAYDMFNVSCFSCLEFERFIEKNFKDKYNVKTIVNELLGLGVFHINNGISFAHKIYKEYFAAYFLINEFPLNENKEKYILLSEKDEWKEVFIFVAGMFKSLNEQDEFFELLLDRNLKLYVQCVNAESDLNNVICEMSHNEYVIRYVKIFMKTYMKITDKYFNQIKNLFDPIAGLNESKEDKKVCLVCAVSKDQESLYYLFDRVEQKFPSINIIDESEIADYNKKFSQRAILQRRNFQMTFVNLKLSNLMGDSSRKIVLKKIRNELKNIIKKRMLFESDYLLCERVAYIIKKFPELKYEGNLSNVHNYIKMKIRESFLLTNGRQVDSIVYDGVDMISFERVLQYLIDKKIELKNYTLPGMDNLKSGGGLIWNLYSQQQKENRISKFFYWHQLSYINMVEKNFPDLCNLFNRYQDTPYQTIIYFIPNHQESQGHYFEPTLCFYYVASDNEKIKLPMIKIVDGISSKDYNIFGNQIENSYIKKGRKVKHFSIASAGFTFTTTSLNTMGNFPLQHYVYQSIKDDLENIFGKF